MAKLCRPALLLTAALLTVAAHADDIPLTPRPHMDDATLAVYNRIRSADGWLVGLGSMVEGKVANKPFRPITWDGDMARWQALYGAQPPCYEWDLGEANQARARRDWDSVRKYADQGGLPWLRISLNNFSQPFGGRDERMVFGGMNDTRGGLDPVLPGGDHHDEFVAYLTQLAHEIKDFGRPCVLRPFHEMNAGWFWWGGQPEKYQHLWHLTFDLFQREGVHNVIWCWACTDFRPERSAQPFYPGDDVVDIVGPDQYFDGPNLPETSRQRLAELAEYALDKPIFLCELGPLARADFWRQLPDELATIPRLRGMMLWLARGWKAWGRDRDPARGSLLDELSPPETMSAFRDFLVEPRSITLARWTAP